MGKRLIVAQLNARHSVAVLDICSRVLIEEKIDILLLQEPPLALERHQWHLDNYRIYLACGDHPLTAILVKSSICTSRIDIPGNRLCGVIVQSNIGDLWVFSAYIRPTTGEGLDQLSHGLDLAAGRT